MVVSSYLRCFSLCFDVLRENINMKGIAKEWYCFKHYVKYFD